MSNVIDDGVVEMRFDNKQFENNVSESLSTIEKLKRSLNFEGSEKGLENIEATAKNCKLSGLSNAIEAVQSRFSTMEVVAITAIANITNTAVNAGKRIVSALTIDPIKSGFEEYETQINAVQTILANTSSKGTTLEQVNNALDELNHYADMTIYNFTEMTRNIGTFTAAGVDLDTSVAAIKGIANLAAVSGSNSQQASTAMYQLSQALASGTVKLQDWNSVVNAGMGGQVFQDALKETAKVHGIAIDQMIEEEGSFRETLSEGWLTSDILTETLSKFTGDLNEQQLKTMGYTEEQIAAIMKMGKTANDAATKVKTFSQLKDTLMEAVQSGWTQSWQTIIGDFEEAKELYTSISDTLSEVINESSNARNAMLDSWKDLGGRTKLIEAFKNAFEGIVSILKPVKEAFREIFPPTTGEQLFSITDKFEKLTEKFKIGEQTSENLKNTFKGLFTILNVVKQAFEMILSSTIPIVTVLVKVAGLILNVTGSIGSWISKLNSAKKSNDNFVNSIKKFNLFENITNRISNAISSILNSTNGLKSSLKTIGNTVKQFFSGVGDAVGNAFEAISDRMSSADFNGIFDIINIAAIGGIVLSIKKFIESTVESFSGITDALGNIPDILDGVRGCFEAYQTNLKAGTLLKIATAIAILAAALVAVSLIDSEKLMGAITAISALFGELVASMAIMTKMKGSIKNAAIMIPTMIAMSTSILILASALKKVGELDSEQISNGIAGIAGLSVILVATAKAMSSNEKKMIRGATSMVVFSVALNMLAKVCKDLGTMDTNQMQQGLLGVAALFGIIDIFLNTAKFSSKSITTAAGILVLSGAIKILASACKDFGEMDWTQLKQGLLAIGGLLGEITVFTNLNGNSKNLISTGVSLIAISAAIKIMASACKDFSDMSWEEIASGLTAMGGTLLIVSKSVNSMSQKGLIGTGVGLIAVSASLKIMASALKDFGNMSWEEIAKGLVAMGVALAELAIGLNAMNGTLAGSAALAIASVSLLALVPVLTALGSMSWESIAKGLIALGGAFAVIGISAALLSPILPAILGLSAALALIGAGVFLAGTGLVAFGAGLASVAAGLNSFTNLVGNVTETVAKVVDIVVTFLDELLKKLAEAVPSMTESGINIIVGFLDAISSRIGDIVNVVTELIVNFVNAITENLPKIVEAGFNLIITFLNSLADALRENSELLGNTVENVITAILEAAVSIILSFGASFLKVGATLIKKLAEGIKSLVGNVKKAASEIIEKVITTIKNKTKELKNVGINAIKGFINGIKSGLKDIASAASNIGSTLLNGIKSTLNIHSPSKETEQLGEYAVEGFSDGVENSTSELKKTVTDAMIEAVLNPIEESIDSLSEKVIFGTSAADKLANTYDSLKEEIADTNGLRKADALIYEYGKNLYKESEQYKKDTESIKEHRLELKKLVAKRAELQKQLDEQSKKGTKEAKTKVKSIKNSLEKLKDSISTAYDKIKSDEDSMVEHMKETYTNFRDTISNTIKDSINPLKASLDTRVELLKTGLSSEIDIFKEFSDTSDTTAKDLLKNMDSQINGITKWEQNIKRLTDKGLSEDLINKLKSMGTSGASYVNLFLSMSQREIKQANEAFQKSIQMSDNMTTENILNNMETQVKSVIEWNNNLKSLSQKGFASGLLDKLKELGTSGADYVKAFMNMTDEEMKRANDSFTESSKLTAQTLLSNFEESLNDTKKWVSDIQNLTEKGFNQGLIESLSKMGTSSSEYVNAFLSMTADEIKEFNEKYLEYLSLPDDAADNLISSFILSGEKATNSFGTILSNSLDITNKETATKSAEIGNTVITNLGTAITEQKETVTSKATDVGNAVYNGLNDCLSEEKGKYIGSQVCEGLIIGLMSGKSSVSSMARQVAYEAYKAACDELDINSPSKKFEGVGKYSVAGFIKGFSENAGNLINTVKNIGKDTVSGFNSIVSNMAEAFDENIEYEPSIKPVLDLTSVEEGMSDLNDLFLNNPNRKFDIFNPNIDAISREMNTYSKTAPNTNPETKTSIFNFEQNNYSPKALSRIDIYRQTKNQFSMMKGAIDRI